MFCKVCRDAGRPESEYTSHFVKNVPGPGGKVVCPTLLSQSCRTCNERGHTSSYCPRREDYRREDYRREDYRRDDRRDDRREEPRREEPRRTPYAQPHGPRVRLQLESRALSTASAFTAAVATAANNQVNAINDINARPFDVRAANINHSNKWEDEALEPFEPFVCDPEQMFRELQAYVESQEPIESQEQEPIESQINDAEACFFGSPEYDFIETCNNQARMPFCCE